MKAYLDSPELKEKFVAEVKKHKDADQIVQGSYGTGTGKNWKGCAVGCAVHSLNRINKTEHSTNNHEVYESELGIPSALAYLEDRIFEGLTKKESKEWPLRFARAINPGADLSSITTQFIIWLLDPKNPTYKNAFPDGKKSITIIRNLHKEVLAGKVVSDSRWSAARSAAWSAARSAESAAWSAAYTEMADKIIKLLEEA